MTIKCIKALLCAAAAQLYIILVNTRNCVLRFPVSLFLKHKSEVHNDLSSLFHSFATLLSTLPFHVARTFNPKNCTFLLLSVFLLFHLMITVVVVAAVLCGVSLFCIDCLRSLCTYVLYSYNPMQEYM